MKNCDFFEKIVFWTCPPSGPFLQSFSGSPSKNKPGFLKFRHDSRYVGQNLDKKFFSHVRFFLQGSLYTIYKVLGGP